MSTHSSARNLFPPLDNPEHTIRKRSHGDPTLLNDFEMATDRNGDPPVPNLGTMEELCQPTLNGRGGPIAPIRIQEMNFGLKNDMIQQSIKVNGVTDDAFRLYLFPHSLTHHATAWFDHLLRNSINTFEQMAKMFLRKYFPPSMVTKLRNEITNFRQRLDESLFEAWEHYKLSIDRSLKVKMAEIHKNLMKVLQINQQVKVVTPSCETVHILTMIVQPSLARPRTYMLREPIKVMNTALSSGSGTLPSNTITNQKEDLKGITTRSGTAYQGPTIPTTSSFSPQVEERETEVTKETVPPTNNGSTKDVQPLVIQVETPISNSEPVVAPVIEPVVAPISALKPNQKPSIPYPF
nr:hypothetical protein [Tanacetum cinerariifolium]